VTPQPTVTTTPEPTVTATPKPKPVKHRLRVRGGPRRVQKARNVPVEIRCDNLGGKRCRGSAHLFLKGRKKAAAKRSFSIKMNTWTKRPLRLDKAVYRLLLRRGSLRLQLRVRAFNQEYGVFTKRITVKVLAPKPKKK
jgi:hypothetical protein